DLSLESDDAMSVGLRSTRRGDDAIGKIGVAHRPLKGLLRSHREADDRAKMRDSEILGEQLMHGPDIVADRRYRAARPVIRLRRVAWARRVPVAEQLGSDEKELRGVERKAWPDQPLVAVVVGHVVRWKQHCVVARRVQAAVRAIDDDRFREHHTGLGAEVLDRELMMLGAVDALGADARESDDRRSECEAE